MVVVEQGAEVHVGRKVLQSCFLRRAGVEFLLPQEAKLLFRLLTPSSQGGFLSLAVHTIWAFSDFVLLGVGGSQFY